MEGVKRPEGKRQTRQDKSRKALRGWTEGKPSQISGLRQGAFKACALRLPTSHGHRAGNRTLRGGR
jgi:hypothetical protein